MKQATGDQIVLLGSMHLGEPYIMGTLVPKSEVERDEPEVFKNIVDFEKQYAISSYGRVYSFISTIIMRPHKDKDGYLIITLSDCGKKFHFKISRLVAIHYIDNPENKEEVNHLREKDDNYYKHLEWSTPKENIKHAFDTGRCNSDHCRYDVKCVHVKTGKVHTFKSIREAERTLKLGSGFGSAVLKGKHPSAKGYTFERILTPPSHETSNRTAIN